MVMHFERSEFLDRMERALEAIAARRLDALLMFQQESMYWLTGYDSFGYCFFQCLLLRADGDLVLLTRAPDLRQAQHTSIIEDIRIWVDRADSEPARQLCELLADKGLSGKRLGVEYESYGLTAAAGRRRGCGARWVRSAVDASDLVNQLRLVKSPAEIAYVRRAAELADAALEAAVAATRAGADEGDILAAMQGAIFAAAATIPGNPFIIGSGRDALLCRYKSGRRKLEPQDQLTLEFAGVWRHYHACLMRTLVVGEPCPASSRCTPPAGRPARLSRRSSARHAHGRGLRRPRPRARRPWLARAPLQRLRLFARHGLRRPTGWTGRCSTPATPSRSVRAWSSFCT